MRHRPMPRWTERISCSQIKWITLLERWHRQNAFFFCYYFYHEDNDYKISQNAEQIHDHQRQDLGASRAGCGAWTASLSTLQCARGSNGNVYSVMSGLTQLYISSAQRPARPATHIRPLIGCRSVPDVLRKYPLKFFCYFLTIVFIVGFLDPEGRSQKATLVVEVQQIIHVTAEQSHHECLYSELQEGSYTYAFLGLL